MLLSLLWSKLQERFNSVSASFKYFDVNSNNAFTFYEFQQGLDRLNMHVSDAEIKRMFEFLDKTNDGRIDYLEFCELCEEKRKGIDPFENKRENKPA